jgi:hypothetical protein
MIKRCEKAHSSVVTIPLTSWFAEQSDIVVSLKGVGTMALVWRSGGWVDWQTARLACSQV